MKKWNVAAIAIELKLPLGTKYLQQLEFTSYQIGPPGESQERWTKKRQDPQGQTSSKDGGKTANKMAISEKKQPTKTQWTIKKVALTGSYYGGLLSEAGFEKVLELGPSEQVVL